MQTENYFLLFTRKPSGLCWTACWTLVILMTVARGSGTPFWKWMIKGALPTTRFITPKQSLCFKSWSKGSGRYGVFLQLYCKIHNLFQDRQLFAYNVTTFDDYMISLVPVLINTNKSFISLRKRGTFANSACPKTLWWIYSWISINWTPWLMFSWYITMTS